MMHLQLEELVSYFFFAQPPSESPLTELDFLRLIQEMGLENANECREVIVQQLIKGCHMCVIKAVLAA